MANHKLLLVDDQADITLALKMGLERYGFEVDTFNDPEQALSHFKANNYDGIVLDIRMPKMSGFQLARAIWEKDHNAKVCFLSAFEINDTEARKVFSHFKSYCFLTKPISTATLAKHLESHILSKT